MFEDKRWVKLIGYRWCLVDGAIVEVTRGKHPGCPGGAAEHRMIATLVSKAEYPDFRPIQLHEEDVA